MLGLSSSLVKGGASLLTFVKDNLKLYLDFKSSKSDTLKFPSAGSTSFDGVNDYINIDGLSFSGDKGTFAFWLNSTQVSAVKHLIDIADADGGNDVQLSFQANSGNQLGIRIGASYTRYSFSNHNDGNWHHVVFVLDGTSGTIYVDGVSETKTIASSLNIVNATKAKIGSDNAGTNRFYEGKLANVAIWSRALEPEEIQSIMNKSYSQLKGVEKTSLVSWWGLDNSSDRGADFWDVGVFTQEGSPTTSTYSNGLLNVVGNGNNTGARFSFPDSGSTSIVGYNQYEFSFDIKITSGVGSGVKIQYHYSQAISSTFNDMIDTTEAPNQEFKRFVTTLYSDNSYSSNRYFVFVQNGNTVAEFQVKNIVLKPITANDSEGSNHGQLVQEATTTTSVYGGNAPILPRAVDVAKEGQADAIGDGSADFSGSTSDYIALSDRIILKGDFSITGWVYRANEHTKIFISDSTVGETLNYIWINGSSKLSIDSPDFGILEFNTTFDHSEWHHIGITRTARIFKAYINGILSDTLDKSSDSNYDADWSFNQFGRYATGTNYAWGGKLAHIGAFQGALTQAQIQSVMESTSYSKIPADVKSTLGAETLTHDFSDGTGVTVPSSLSVASGKTTFNGEMVVNGGDVSSAYYAIADNVTWDTSKLYKIVVVCSAYTSGALSHQGGSATFGVTFGISSSIGGVGTFTNYAIPSQDGTINLRSQSFVGTLSSISIKEVTNDLVAYYPLDAIQPSDFLYAKYVPEATAGALGEELFTGWENEPVQSGAYYKGWSSFTTSGQTVTASQADEGGTYNKVFNTNAFSIVADTAYEINITIDSRTNTYIRGLTASTNSEGAFVVYTSMWHNTTIGSSKYVLLANTTTSNARLHIRQFGANTASITISAISIKPLSGNYGRLL